MVTQLEAEAERLSDRPYAVEIIRDRTTDGAQEVFLLRHPEMPGCMAQGATIEAALSELEEVRRDYILSLLEDDEPVPDPAVVRTRTMSLSGPVGEDVYTSPEDQGTFPSGLARVVQPETRESQVTVEPAEPVFS